MYKYEFVTIKIRDRLFFREPRENYRRIIEEKAKDGWHLVQVFVPKYCGFYKSTPKSFELIFKKKVE